MNDERSGKNNMYSATLPPELAEITLRAASEIPEVASDDLALRHILRKRKDTARSYFDELAGRFGKDYVPGRSWKALAEALIKSLNYRRVADLGAGEGTLSQLLAQRAEKVIAIDLSPKMVEYAQNLAISNGLPNLEFRIGDIEEPPIEEKTIDLAILSQALHHAEHPQKAIDSAYRILAPGGRVIILDLHQHSFEEARELYGDRWLGFSESHLSSMLEKAGFSEIETLIADKEEAPPKFQTLLGHWHALNAKDPPPRAAVILPPDYDSTAWNERRTTVCVTRFVPQDGFCTSPICPVKKYATCSIH